MDKKYLHLLQNLTILYVEDEDGIRQNLETTLKLISKDVYTAKDAQQALDLYNTNNIDIILSDINMPGIDGLEFSKRIRSQNKHIPIILLTAYTDTPYLLEAIKLKLVDYITKPIDFTKLKNALIAAAEEIEQNGNFEVYFENNVVYNSSKKNLLINDVEENITGKEIALLELLIENKNKVVPTQEIKNTLWEDDYLATDSALKAVLNKLRNKIGKKAIKNHSGIGYQLTIL